MTRRIAGAAILDGYRFTPNFVVAVALASRRDRIADQRQALGELSVSTSNFSVWRSR